MKKVTQVTITENFEGVDNLEELLAQEMAQIGKWKEQGLLEHLFAKPDRTGAILVFNETDEDKVKELVGTLPFFPYFTNTEFVVLDLHF